MFKRIIAGLGIIAFALGGLGIEDAAGAQEKIIVRFGHSNAPSKLDVFHNTALRIKEKL